MMPMPDFGAAFVDGVLSNGAMMGNNGGMVVGMIPRQRVPTAVTIKERIVVLNVQSNRKSVSHGFLAGIFGTLDRFGVVVDLISTSEVFVSMAIEDVLDRKLYARLVRDLEKIGIVCPSPSLSLAFASADEEYLGARRCPCTMTW